MKTYSVRILLLTLVLACPSLAIAGRATTTIGVSATVVASCTLPMYGQPARKITTSCTPQTSIRLGQVSANGGQPLPEDSGQQLARSSERMNPTTQTKEITIEF